MLRRVVRQPVLVAWLLLVTWTTLPWLKAEIFPPPGARFVGTFHWVDDFYNYVSYAQQAESGRVLFENKLLLEPQPARLLHVEWWVLGRLSALLGSRPFLAYRILAAALALALFVAVDRWLRAAGLDPAHRLPALLLVGTGGGLGGPIFELTDWPVEKCLDLSMGLFPFVELLSNPHFLAGTTLLVCALLAFGSGRPVIGVVLGTALGLSRPYDLAWLGLLGGLTALSLAGRPVERFRRLLPFLGLLPVLAYLGWVFFGSEAFASFRGRYEFPPPLLLLPALGPAGALALLELRDPALSARAMAARLPVRLWALLAVTLSLLRPPSFGLQFIVGSGLPLLGLAALALSRRGMAFLLGGLLALSPTAVVATRIVTRVEPHWFARPERLEGAILLRSHCRPGQRVLAPPDIGLYVVGLTACRPLTSHPAEPDHAERESAVRAFYTTASPEERQQMLDRFGIDYVVLPGTASARPVEWLGEGTPFRSLVAAGGAAGLTWYGRTGGQ